MSAASEQEEAIAAFHRAVEQYSTFTLAHYRLALAHHMRGEHAFAHRVARTAVEHADRLGPRDRTVISIFVRCLSPNRSMLSRSLKAGNLGACRSNIYVNFHFQGTSITMTRTQLPLSGLTLLVLLFVSTHSMSQTASIPPGDGDINNPWLISTVEHLLWMSDEAAAGSDFAGEYLVQTQDIDASATSTWFPDGSGGFLGFPTIGTSSSEEFQGHYDGAGHEISGLFMNRPGMNRVTLFYAVGTSGSVSNLGLVDVNLTGENVLGALAAINRGLIERCYTTGTIISAATTGGLVATNAPNAVIRDSYSLVDVSSGYRGAGLVGHNLGLIENAFAAGLVTNTSGDWLDSFGGLVGENEVGATIVNGFWDNSTSGYSGVDDGVGDQTQAQSGVVGLSTNQMQDFSTFDGLWSIEGRTNLPQGYPVLQWQVDQDFTPEAPIWLIRMDAAAPLAVPIGGPVMLLVLVLALGWMAWCSHFRTRPPRNTRARSC